MLSAFQEELCGVYYKKIYKIKFNNNLTTKCRIILSSVRTRCSFYLQPLCFEVCKIAECNGHNFPCFFRAFLETKLRTLRFQCTLAERFQLAVTNVPTLCVKCRTANTAPQWMGAPSTLRVFMHVSNIFSF